MVYREWWTIRLYPQHKRKGRKMEAKEYTVTWTVQVSAISYRDAAIQAMQMQTDLDSTANVFEVRSETDTEQNGIMVVDLGDTARAEL